MPNPWRTVTHAAGYALPSPFAAAPTMQPASPLSLDIRSYGRDGAADAHTFAQLVLPLGGSMEVDVEGHGAWLDRTRAAFVAPTARHAQSSGTANRFLVVDVDARALGEPELERLAARRFLPVGPGAAHLIDYMAASLGDDGLPQRAAAWLPLLLDAVERSAPGPASRLVGLLATMTEHPEYDWTAADMAARVGLSSSRLHAVFREELDTTPQAWLAERRIERARRWLADTSLPLAEIALACGYADQSAFTRAFGRAVGLPPAAYRRQAQASRQNRGEP
ncbi:helix-turn-helix transcriptional regulator [Dyella lutea]|uniref:AraC family transcriptional regulator n=1 Tax=Dyella lutea TaxID=2950441 RepID=A0ABT1FAR3_9GAMM|nr:AraC family transcriptional regulator [Dyella lutea]MCP1373483.1 AraC family transcriptional regulator [Dyella lutea]